MSRYPRSNALRRAHRATVPHAGRPRGAKRVGVERREIVEVVADPRDEGAGGRSDRLVDVERLSDVERHLPRAVAVIDDERDHQGQHQASFGHLAVPLPQPHDVLGDAPRHAWIGAALVLDQQAEEATPPADLRREDEIAREAAQLQPHALGRHALEAVPRDQPRELGGEAGAQQSAASLEVSEHPLEQSVVG